MPTQQPSNELEAFLEHITITRGLSTQTIKAYESDLLLIELEAKKPLITLQSEELFSLLGTYENKRTLNRKLSAVNSFYDFCFHSAFLEENHHFEFAKIPKTLPRFLSYEEIMQGLGQIDTSSWIGLRDYALLYFLYASGARISEALALQKDDIEGEWLRIRHAKGQKERVVPLAKSAIEVLKSYLQERPFEEKYIWTSYQKKQLSRISAYKITKKYLGVSPHALRHSYATALVSGGADLRVVQELLGHSSLLTTQIYTHIQKQQLQETLEVFHPMNKH